MAATVTLPPGFEVEQPAASTDVPEGFVIDSGLPPGFEVERPTLRNAPDPTWRERLARFLIGDERPSPTWERIVSGITGSAGSGHSNVGLVDVFPPTGIALAGDETIRASREGHLGEAALNALGVIPAPIAMAPRARAARAAAAGSGDAVSSAANRLDVRIPKAAVAEGFGANVADFAKEIPTVAKNPIRAAADDALAGIETATEGVRSKTLGDQGDIKTAARGLDDWLTGYTPQGAAIEGQAVVDELANLRAAQPAKAAPASRGGHGMQEIVTPDTEMTILARPELVELDELHRAQGAFQPRDRTRPEYGQEVRERAARLDPLQLQPSRVSDSGPPIVLPDNTIISGNGRAMSIAHVYADPSLKAQADAYRASLGTEAQRMRQPVLVMRSEPMTPDDAARFADLSNRSRIATMSAPERAARDAAAMRPEEMALYQGGDFNSPANVPFMQAFSRNAVSRTELNSFSKNGQLTQEGAARMRAAVLHSAYGDSQLISRMLESSDDNIRNITGALVDAAPGFSRMRADVEAGYVLKDLDVTEQVVDAVKLIANLRDRGVTPAAYLPQLNAFEDLDPIVEAWVRAFYNDDLIRPISRQKMAEVLNAYTTEARKHAPGGMFGDAKVEDVLNASKRSRVGGLAEEADFISDIPQNPRQGAAYGGPEAQGPSAPGGIVEAVGDAGAANAGDARAATSGDKILSPERSHQITQDNLSAARKEAIGRALGIDPDSSPSTVIASIIERASDGRGADIAAILEVRKLIGNKAWADHVAPRIIQAMGGGRIWQAERATGGMSHDGWSLEKFASAWSDLTNNAKNAIARSTARKGLRDDLDALAKLSEVAPRLRALSHGELEDIVSRVPIAGALLRWGIRGWVGQMFAHLGALPATAGATLAMPATGYVVGKMLASPITAGSVSRYAQSFMALLKAPKSNATVAAFRFAAQSLSSDMVQEFGGEAEDYMQELFGTPRASRIEDVLHLPKGARFFDPHGVERVR